MKNSLKFVGSGSSLFGLTIVNALLTIVTLGIYYPWAKVKYLKYYYQNTLFADDHFTFHGTGKQVFVGFIKALGFIFVLVFIYAFLLIIGGKLGSSGLALKIIAIIIYIGGFMAFIPMAIHGTLRYRMAKTSWRGIHFGYRGNLTELIKIYVKGILLTLLTLGIYTAWFEVELRQYITKHLRMGNMQFKFTGRAKTLFVIFLKGFFLSIITFGFYFFWFISNLFKYYIEHTELEHEGQTYKVKANVSGLDVFAVYVLNAIIIIFTLGLGFAWAEVNKMKLFIDHIEIPEELNTDTIQQTEDDYSDATGEGALDFLDFGLITM